MDPRIRPQRKQTEPADDEPDNPALSLTWKMLLIGIAIFLVGAIIYLSAVP